MNSISKLIETLEKSPKSKKIEKLIKLSEFESAVDIPNQFERLMGVWELRCINLTFEKAGIIGPQVFGKNMVFLSEIKKAQTGWLDTTVLTDKLRVCRGYKGTTFALLKREDLLIADFFNPINN